MTECLIFLDADTEAPNLIENYSETTTLRGTDIVTPPEIEAANSSGDPETQFSALTRVKKGQPFIEFAWENQDGLSYFVPISPSFAQYCQGLYRNSYSIYPAHLMFNAMMQFSRKDAIDREWGKRSRMAMLDSLHNNQLSSRDKNLSALIDMFEEVTDFPLPDGTSLHGIPTIQGTVIGYIESIKPAYHSPPDDPFKYWTVRVCLMGCGGRYTYTSTPDTLFLWLIEEEKDG